MDLLNKNPLPKYKRPPYPNYHASDDLTNTSAGQH
jgi:hypothetical protein